MALESFNQTRWSTMSNPFHKKGFRRSQTFDYFNIPVQSPTIHADSGPETTTTTKRSHRLSKPPINFSSSDLLAAASDHPDPFRRSSPVSPTTEFGETEPVNTSQTGDRRSRLDTRHKIRSLLFDVNGELLSAEPTDLEEPNETLTMPIVRRKPTRRGSLVTSASKGSLSTFRSSKASPVDESMLTAADSTNLYDAIRQQAEVDKKSAQSYLLAPTDGARPMAPIRRTSLMMPGIATRSPGNDVLRKPGSFESTTSRTSSSTQSSSQGFGPSSWNAYNGSTLDPVEEWSTPVPGAATPCDTDYGYLGGLKWGTLHIVNGRASPSPSDISALSSRRRSISDLRSEASKVPDFPQSKLLAVQNLGLPTPESIYSRHFGKTPVIAYAKSPLAQAASHFDSEHDSDARDYFRGNGNRSPDRSSWIAEQYAAELPESPFSFDETSEELPKRGSLLLATSKTTEMDDDLFEDEAVDNVTPDDSYLSHSDTQYKSVADERNAKTHLETPRGRLSKSDSGYSSVSSLHSVYIGRGRSQVDHHRVSTVDEDPVTPPTPMISVSGPEEAPRQSRQFSIRRKPTPPEQRASMASKAESEPRDSRPPTATDDSATSGSIHEISSTPSEVMRTPKKLRKQRPRSMPPPVRYITVQAVRDLGDTYIPPVPVEMAESLAVRQFATLEHTFPSLHHTGNKGLPDADFEVVPLRFPRPADDFDDGCSVDSIDIFSHGQGGSSRKRLSARLYDVIHSERKSEEKRRSFQHNPPVLDVIPSIADFGDVTLSLGSSPYDIARPTSIALSDTEDPKFDVMVPHNITTSIRRKSVVGMDDEAATQFARLRSKSIHERDVERNTLKNKKFNDRGGVPGKNIRPRSVGSDVAPPMPELTHKSIERFSMPPTPMIIQTPPKKQVPALAKPFSATTLSTRSPLQSLENRYSSEITREPHEFQKKAREIHRSRSAGEALVKQNSKSRKPVAGKIEIFDAETEAAAANNFLQVPTPKLNKRKSSQDKLTPRPSVCTVRSAVSNASTTSRYSQCTMTTISDYASNVGRYSGGFEHGYERGAGIAGSAGTRNSWCWSDDDEIENVSTRRKDNQSPERKLANRLSTDFGIDMGDIPIFEDRMRR